MLMSHTDRSPVHFPAWHPGAATVVAIVTLGLVAAGCAGPAPRPARSPLSASATLRAAEPAPVPGARLASLGQLAVRPAGAQEGRRIVRNATLTLEVRKARAVAEALARAREVTRRHGGYVASERSGGLVARVPAERMDAALAELAALGRVAKKQITAEDVTARYVDLEIRLENARRLQARLRDLLSRTSDVSQILAVEKELARVTGELERLEGQLRLMRQLTTYATIDVSVREAVRPGPLGWIFAGIYLGAKWLFVWD